MKAYHTMMKSPADSDTLIVFPSKLGWMGLCAGPKAVRRLSFGHPTAVAAAKAVGQGLAPCEKLLPWQRALVKMLQAYAEGARADFSDVEIELNGASDFRQRVLTACRGVSYGKTKTYGELAVQAGAAGAARAVGTCMARNPIPLIIPCHRVTRAGGIVGPYSAPGGTKTKRRLLAMEAANGNS